MSRQTGQSLLLLIPAHDEERRIGAALEEYLREFQRALPGRHAIVVILNGCQDGTLEVVAPLAEAHPPLRVIDIPERVGKGGAIIRGIREATQAGWIAYADADGATPPREILRLAELCRHQDCVIGSRWLPGAVLSPAQPLLRRVASRVFHAVVQLLFGLGVKDTQCPAKVISMRAARQVAPHLRIADLAFDVNLLYALRRGGFAIQEVPVEWNDKSGSRVGRALFRSSLTMFLSVVRLRLYHSPLYPWLKPLRGLERWIYHRLRAPLIPWGDDRRED